MITEPAYKIGARFQTLLHEEGWSSMGSAPRDGTPVELRNSSGAAPTYSLCRWTDEERVWGGERRFGTGTFQWWNCDETDPSYPSDTAQLSWRPYSGEPSAYVDPTGGVQTEAAYWRGAVAQQYGLRPDYFEKQPSFSSWLRSKMRL